MLLLITSKFQTNSSDLLRLPFLFYFIRNIGEHCARPPRVIIVPTGGVKPAMVRLIDMMMPAIRNLRLRHRPKRVRQLLDRHLDFERCVCGKAHQEAGLRIAGSVQRR